MTHANEVAGDSTRRSKRTRSRRRLLAPLALLSALALLAASAAAAQAAGLPKVNTNGAREVSYSSAVLTGSVNPSASSTSYYFQYGVTKAYGSQTAIANAGSGSKAVPVRLGITGLQPLTVYHYRLVAVNSAGATIGDDEKLLTTKVPLSLAILTSPNPVPFGGLVTVQGTLSGTGNASRVVALQANAFPFTAGFQNVGNAMLTSSTGAFDFIVPILPVSTQFRVVTTPSNPVVSPVATENVAVRVTSHVARAKRRGFARVFGTVTPAVNGAQVGILRVAAQNQGILVGGTVLKPLNAVSSQFSRVVRVRKGAYRVLVKVAPGPMLTYGPGGLISAYGTPLLIH
jgi:hypothetical protein